MTPNEHRAEAERLAEVMEKMSKDYIELDTNAREPRAQHLDLYAMISRRAEIHALLSKEN